MPLYWTTHMQTVAIKEQRSSEAQTSSNLCLVSTKETRASQIICCKYLIIEIVFFPCLGTDPSFF